MNIVHGSFIKLEILLTMVLLVHVGVLAHSHDIRSAVRNGEVQNEYAFEKMWTTNVRNHPRI